MGCMTPGPWLSHKELSREPGHAWPIPCPLDLRRGSPGYPSSSHPSMSGSKRTASEGLSGAGEQGHRVSWSPWNQKGTETKPSGPRDLCGCPGGGAPGMEWVEARPHTQHPGLHTHRDAVQEPLGDLMTCSPSLPALCLCERLHQAWLPCQPPSGSTRRCNYISPQDES